MKKHFIVLLMFTYVATSYIQAQVPTGAATNFVRPGRDTVRPQTNIASQVATPPVSQNNSQIPTNTGATTTEQDTMLITGIIAESFGMEWKRNNEAYSISEIELSGKPTKPELQSNSNYKWICRIKFSENLTPLITVRSNYSAYYDVNLEIRFPINKYEEIKALLEKGLRENKYFIYITTNRTRESNGSTTAWLAALRLVAK